LDYQNIKIFKELDNIDEVSIGHSVIARAVFTGVEEAVKEMIRLIKK
jgi:pyridoxine 5-phosphate synthase